MLTREQAENPGSAKPGEVCPLVVISILNWNGWKETVDCLESVRRLAYANYLTVVVDNGSADDSVERMRAWARETLPDPAALVEYTREEALAGGRPAPEALLDAAASPHRLVLIRNEENRGFAGGNNVSLRYALTRTRQAEFVFLLNNDALVAPDCLTRLVAITLRTGAGLAEAAICGEGETVPAPPFRPPKWHVGLERLCGNDLGTFPIKEDFCEIISARGAAVLASAALLRKIYSCKGEYLHERFFIYAEDMGISVRARALGFHCIRVNKALATHKGGGGAGGRYNPVAYYYDTRNHIHLSKEMSTAGKLIVHLLYNSLSLARVGKSVLHGRWRAASAILQGMLDGYLGRMGKWKYHDLEAARSRR